MGVRRCANIFEQGSISLQQHPKIAFFQKKRKWGWGVAHKLAQMEKNGQIIEFLGKWSENLVVIAWSSFLSIDFIETAFSDNILVNKSGSGINGSPLSRYIRWKMA